MGNSLFYLNHFKNSQFKPNSVILITGASSGIGEEMAYQYAVRGVRLFLCARSVDKLKQVSEKCKALGSECDFARCDVSNEEDCKKAIAQCIEKFGGLDVLVVNAGINAHFFFEEVQDMAIFEKLMKTNFFGYLYPTKHAFPHLKKNKGQIVVISSASGEVGFPKRTAYCASKFAVTGFFESLRIETEGSGVSITIICPPSVDTPMRSKDPFMNQNGNDHKDEEKRLPVDQCVTNVLLAADRKARKVYFPTGIYFGNYIRPFLPWAVDAMIMQKSKI
jgi:short-subunit dehydrogenase